MEKRTINSESDAEAVAEEVIALLREAGYTFPELHIIVRALKMSDIV